MVRPPLGTFLVAWLDGTPAGCGALKPLDSDPTVGEIKRMYTAPSARRQGVSRRLLEHLERAAAELGYRRIQLETGLAQPEAMALYESHGWHRITPYGHYKHSPQSVCFATDLDSS
jgi:putative acetyltransferase